MLGRYGISTIQSIANGKMGDLAKAISAAVARGDSADTLAGNITDLVASPSRAEMIAHTEIARAVTQAAVDRYRQAGVTQVTWLTARRRPCVRSCSSSTSDYGADRCGESFPSGDDRTASSPGRAGVRSRQRR